jgi:hypothetical protein
MRKALISLLVLLLVAPLNASAASWMAMSMSHSDLHQQHAVSEDAGHNHHKAGSQMATHDDAQSGQHHEHTAADCEEHCASCTNHCSSLGIVTSAEGLIDTERSVVGMLFGAPSNRFELLFRPPILA